MRVGLHDLPEPADLHAQLSTDHPLDWGNPVPTKAEIATQYGPRWIEESLRLLTKAASVEPDVTRELVSAVGAVAAPYQLVHRVKSPQSLARKLKTMAKYNHRSSWSPEDVLRYTAAVKHPDELTKAAVQAIDRLKDQGWQMSAAQHSYVDGSRYKGLHTFLDSHGERIELQVHSSESILVKEQTTPLYEIERDREQERAARDKARRECIALSAQLTQPMGIDELKELGGVAVSAISYGKPRRTNRSEATEKPGLTTGTGQGADRQPLANREDGIAR
jgi:hypothetical protein